MCALRAATIGGASVGSHGSQSVTELDSHANMAVAGRDCTIIAKSGHYASVTPFSADLPVMERVEIGDVAIAYDNPYSLETYLLVMRKVLLIPSMDLWSGRLRSSWMKHPNSSRLMCRWIITLSMMK